MIPIDTIVELVNCQGLFRVTHKHPAGDWYSVINVDGMQSLYPYENEMIVVPLDELPFKLLSIDL